MPSAKDLTVDKRFFALFVGESGSGKTVAECSFPGPVEVLDFDGRIRGILNASWIDRENIRYEYFPPRMQNLAKAINDKLKIIDSLARVGQQSPSTVILDSITNQCTSLLVQAMDLTHVNNKGKKIGDVSMAGPEDYGYEASVTYDVMSWLRTIPVQNIIVSAHLIDRFGKANPGDPFSETVIIGKKLSIRDKIGTNISTLFDHVFEFSRKMHGNEIRFYVKFWGDLARTSYPNLPVGEIDITGKDFYKVLMSYVKGLEGR